jgi:hypothetical protein
VEEDRGIRDKNERCDILADQIRSMAQDLPAWWLWLGQLKTKVGDERPILRELMWHTRLEQHCSVGWTLDRPYACPRRKAMIQEKVAREIQIISRSRQLDEQERTKRIQMVQMLNDYSCKAVVTQEKGRLGYGEWEHTIGYDGKALGFFDLAQELPQAEAPITEEESHEEAF